MRFGVLLLLALVLAPVAPAHADDKKVPDDLVLLRNVVDRLIAAKQRILSLEAEKASAEVLPLRADVEKRLKAALKCKDSEDLNWTALTCVAKPKPDEKPKSDAQTPKEPPSR